MKGGAVLFVGFEGTSLSAPERRILARVRPAGITLVPRNIADADQLQHLVGDLRSIVPAAILALDAEGGRVDRLRGLVGPAPAAAVLARFPPALAARAGLWVGESLRSFGFDLDLAPVVDLDHGLIANALDGRCLGSTPRAVTARAGAFLDGLHRAGVGCCLKHLPGLGRASRDTHLSSSEIGADRAELAPDLIPFARLAAHSEAVMVGHAIYPALDPECRPATFSAAIASHLLRRELRFRGALLSDDLEMGALAPWGGLEARAEAALSAGCDGMLVCRQIDAAPAIASRLGRTALRQDLERASRRIARLRRDLTSLRRQAGPSRAVEELRRRLEALGRTLQRADA